MHHLLFVVHGMGQMRDKFVRNCKAMQDTLEFIASNRDFNGQELHIIPIEWHSILHKLPSVDARMDKVTLPTVPLFRMINNHYLADLLYYFARFHGKAIVSICADLMNAQYLHYTEKYGSVECSLMGHSLGGIISYDILCHQVEGCSELYDECPKLLFAPINLFAVGSPIAAVLVMRGLEYSKYCPLPTLRLHNMFHPYDPMAYRLEPLMDESYSQREPLLIEHWNHKQFSLKSGILSFPYRLASSINFGAAAIAAWGSSDIGDMFKAVFYRQAMTPVNILSMGTIRDSDDVPARDDIDAEEYTEPSRKRRRCNSDSHHSYVPDEVKDEDSTDAVTVEQPSVKTCETNQARDDSWLQSMVDFASSRIFASSTTTQESPSAVEEQISERKRHRSDSQSNDSPGVDYALRINMLETLRGEYLTGLPVHFNYWSNKDIVFHILKHCLT